MRTYCEVGPRHGFQSGNKDKRWFVMTDTFKANTLDAALLPKSTLAWSLCVACVDNLDRSAKPEECEMPSTARNQPLVREDAVNLCYLDVEVLCQSNTHTKLRGRNMRAKVRIEPIQDSGVFEHLGTNNEPSISTNT